ncbi:DeoR/GlpR family DNA-binding transcription regulator [Oceanibium sediminis]|uniref:DeoR/GlpR family DNA-binding transcription regulator n=1 Tax=Oceanibium sediminis TaxID=2026339 RepID=UPI000DD386AC|nr:DeoR/GlpR family DNA-binding transcription regulator [Oceanibium sediminis]
MLNSHRREHILERLSYHDRISVADVAARLNVSDETVRRDLKDLEQEGLLRRVHGGAIGVSSIRDEPISERVRKHTKEKGIIAKLAADLISDQTSIFLHIGSTTEALARQLGRFSDLKVYTNSLNVAQIAKEHFGVSVFVAPGQLRKDESDLVGYDTISYLQGYYFDTAFMSVAGVDAERGFMDFEEDEVRIRQTLMKCARNKVVMADSSKFGKSANMCTAPFEAVDRVVTDRKPAADFGKRFKKAGLDVIHG